MTTLTVRDFRSRLSSSLNKVDAGERVLIHRNNQFYCIIPVEIDSVSPRERTLEAIHETKSGSYAGTLNMENFDEFMHCVSEIE